MTTSIRIRIIDVQLPADHVVDKLIDPFWLLLSFEDCPCIGDVKSKIITKCQEILDSKKHIAAATTHVFLTQQTADHDDDAGVLLPKSSSLVHSTGQLWLDGCRLLDSERTNILRDNDSVVVKYSGIVQRPHNVGNESENEDDKSCSLALKGSHSRKRKRLKSKDREISDSLDLTVEDEVQTSSRKQKKKKRRQEKEFKDEETEESVKNNVLCRLEGKELVHNGAEKELCLEKRDNKKRRPKESNSKTGQLDGKSCERNGETNELVTALFSPDGTKDPGGVGFSEMVESELEKRSVQLMDCSNSTSNLLQNTCLVPTTPKGSEALDVSVDSKKRKRRRKPKKKKGVNEKPKFVKVEDKPKSSELNLTWNQRAQNIKFVFDSDTSCDDSVLDEKTSHDKKEYKIEDTGNTSLEAQITNPSNDNCNTNTHVGEICNKKLNENKSDGIALSKMSKGDSKPLPYKSKRFLLRSTGSILDSIRSTSAASPEIGKTKKSRKAAPPVEQTKSSLNAVQNEQSIHQSPTPSIEKHCRQSLSPSIAKSSTQLNTPTFVSPNPKSTCSSLTPPTEMSPYRSLPSPTVTFNELLQRRKLSNCSTVVSTGANGVTLVSRRKGPRQKDTFANPETDILTNKSIIKSPIGNDTTISKPTHPCEGLTNGFHSKKSPQLASDDQTRLIDGEAGNCDVFGGSEKEDGCAKVEVTPLDIEAECPPLTTSPFKGQVIAYKILEMGEDYAPSVSEFKIGKVLNCQDGFVNLELFGDTATKRRTGKFDLVYEEENETQTITTSDKAPRDNQVYVEISAMIDARLVTLSSNG